MSDENKWDVFFTWNIENFSLCNSENGENIASPIFVAKVLDNSEWYLSIYPKGKTEKYKEYISCALHKVFDNDRDEEITIDYETSLSVDGKILKDIPGGITTFKYTKQDWCWVNFMEISDVLNELKTCSNDTLTVCYSVKRNTVAKQLPEKHKARTKIVSDTYSCELNIKYDDLICGKQEKSFFSLKGSIYEVCIAYNKEYVLITITAKTVNANTSRKILGKISVLDKSGNEFISKNDSHTFNIEEETWNFPNFISKQLLESKGLRYMKNGSTVLQCEFSVPRESTASLNLHQDIVSDINDLLSLRDDFHTLLSNKRHSDVKLRVDKNKVVLAHRAVLAARSPVFAAMFEQDLRETQTGIVDIVDLDDKTMNTFLEFIYSGEMKYLDYESVSKLLMVADKYQVLSLKEKCSNFLMSILSMENVCEILVLADLIDHEILKACVLNYIAKHASVIFSSLKWSELMEQNVKLTASVIACIGKNFKLIPNISANSIA